MIAEVFASLAGRSSDFSEVRGVDIARVGWLEGRIPFRDSSAWESIPSVAPVDGSSWLPYIVQGRSGQYNTP